MRNTTLALLSLTALAFAGCQSTSGKTCPDTQAIVDSVAANNPDIVRLTVHAIPPSGGEYHAVASTAPDKLGKPSDPEDFDAMKSGQTVVLDEAGAVDITVPVLQQDGKWTAAVGVTLKTNPGDSKDQVTARGQQIAHSIAAQMSAKTAK